METATPTKHVSPEQGLHPSPWNKNTSMPLKGALSPPVLPATPSDTSAEEHLISPASRSPTSPQAFSISFSEKEWGTAGSALGRTIREIHEETPQPKTLGDAIAAAAESHDEAEALEQVGDFLADGVNPNDSAHFHAGQAPLFWACHYGLVQVTGALLEHKADLERREDGATALHSAAINGKHEVVRLLTQANASLDALNKNGSTALHLAALKGHAATCQVLVEAGADAAIRSQYYKGEFKDNETVEEEEGATALQIAEKKRHRDIVALLG
jgi:hypothetical protein